jgi:ABC-type phosphate/phosphonate transport system permease subunit
LSSIARYSFTANSTFDFAYAGTMMAATTAAPLAFDFGAEAASPVSRLLRRIACSLDACSDL